MRWNDQIFAYCERGADPAFWAEPLNALSNVGFIVAALAACAQWRLGRRGPAEAGLIALAVAVGIGSFLFHTLATRWARLADTAPIGLFMLSYLCLALRRMMGLAWIEVAAWLGAFLAAGALIAGLDCSKVPCFNGSVGYAPALTALVVVTIVLARRGHPAAHRVGTAGGLFLVALVFRSIDLMACPAILVRPGWQVGTHALWHLANAGVVYLLLVAAMRGGRENKVIDR